MAGDEEFDRQPSGKDLSSSLGKEVRMKTLLLTTLTVCVAASVGYAATLMHGWEDGISTVLGLYGSGTPPIIATNVGYPDTVYEGLRSLRLEDNSPSGTPQAYLAWITNLSDGDVVTASFWRFDTTAASPSCRVWGHWNDYPCDINGYSGSAGGNSDYGPGEGWDEASHSWTVADGHTGLVVECRTYSNPGDVVWIDALTVTAPEHADIFMPGEEVTARFDLFVSDAFVECHGDTTLIFYEAHLGTCAPSGELVELMVDNAIDFFLNDWYLGWTKWVIEQTYEATCAGQPLTDCPGGYCPYDLYWWNPLTGETMHLDSFCTLREGFSCYCDCAITGCPYVYVGPWPLAAQQDYTLRIVVDPDNDTWEWDESNNEFTVPIGPSAADPPTWGSIKAMYR
jgi:hypothetical protein